MTRRGMGDGDVMGAASDRTVPGPGIGLARMVDHDGSAAHAYPGRLALDQPPLQDLADTLHQLGALHARHPGVVDQAMNGIDDPRIRPWLRTSAAGFAEERAYLIRLAAAAGPPPGTPGQAAAEAAMTAQRHAIDLLGQSVRPGCALGAAVALVLDWSAIRRPLDSAAIRLGIEPVPLGLPTRIETVRMIEDAGGEAPMVRAMTFGVQQLLAQHRGLWDLLDARADARRALRG